MELSWLQSIVLGLISGLTEFLPVSASAHQIILLRMFGIGQLAPVVQLMIHGGCLACLTYCLRPVLHRISAERRLLRTSRRRRTRQPDAQIRADVSFLKTAAIPLLLGLLFSTRTQALGSSLFLVSVFLLLNGVALFVPQFLRTGNKDSRHMSRMDAVIIGLFGAASVFPGVSRMAMLTSVSRCRGGDRRFSLDMALLLSIPALILMVIFDVFAVINAGIGILSAALLVSCLLSAIFAYIGTYFAVQIMRSLSVNTGFSGAAYYCWGAALFTFILYLTT